MLYLSNILYSLQLWHTLLIFGSSHRRTTASMFGDFSPIQIRWAIAPGGRAAISCCGPRTGYSAVLRRSSSHVPAASASPRRGWACNVSAVVHPETLHANCPTTTSASYPQLPSLGPHYSLPRVPPDFMTTTIITSSTAALLLPLLFAVQGAAASAGDGHGELPYEWGGTFETPGTDYAWTMQIKKGAWADPSMKLAVLATTGTAASDLEAQKGTADVRVLPTLRPFAALALLKPLSPAPPHEALTRVWCCFHLLLATDTA